MLWAALLIFSHLLLFYKVRAKCCVQAMNAFTKIMPLAFNDSCNQNVQELVVNLYSASIQASSSYFAIQTHRSVVHTCHENRPQSFPWHEVVDDY